MLRIPKYVGSGGEGPYSERAEQMRENDYRDGYGPRNRRWDIKDLRFQSLDRNDGGIW